MKRVKSHFYRTPFGVDIILGLNGYLWISKSPTAAQEKAANGKFCEPPVDPATRKIIARMRNCLLAMSKEFVQISPSTIEEVFEASLGKAEVALLKPDVIAEITKSVKSRNSSGVVKVTRVDQQQQQIESTLEPHQQSDDMNTEENASPE